MEQIVSIVSQAVVHLMLFHCADYGGTDDGDSSDDTMENVTNERKRVPWKRQNRLRRRLRELSLSILQLLPAQCVPRSYRREDDQTETGPWREVRIMNSASQFPSNRIR